MGGTRTDGAGGDNAKNGSKDERNEKEESEEWDEEDGEKEEEEEERRKEDAPTEAEGKVVLKLKNLFEPASNEPSNCKAQLVTETLEGHNNSSSKETATLQCFLRDWLGFNYSEEQDDAEWEQDIKRGADDVSDGDGE